MRNCRLSTSTVWYESSHIAKCVWKKRRVLEKRFCTDWQSNKARLIRLVIKFTSHESLQALQILLVTLVWSECQEHAGNGLTFDNHLRVLSLLAPQNEPVGGFSKPCVSAVFVPEVCQVIEQRTKPHAAVRGFHGTQETNSKFYHTTLIHGFARTRDL